MDSFGILKFLLNEGLKEILELIYLDIKNQFKLSYKRI